MSGGFKGWRRKIGLLTLVIALAFMGGWLRSLVAPEHFYFLCDGDNSNRLVSLKGNIDWERLHQEGAKRLSQVQFSTAKLILEKDKKRIFEWKWTFWGFGRGEYRSELLDELKSSNPLLPFESMMQSVWRIPYWSLTIPLTLLSAWLLLGKPRKTTQMKIFEAVITEGT